jgi:hypothetical protein
LIEATLAIEGVPIGTRDPQQESLLHPHPHLEISKAQDRRKTKKRYIGS